MAANAISQQIVNAKTTIFNFGFQCLKIKILPFFNLSMNKEPVISDFPIQTHILVSDSVTHLTEKNHTKCIRHSQ